MCLRKPQRFLLGAQDQRLGVERDQIPCGSTGTSSGNCQATETCVARACHTQRQCPLEASDAVVRRGDAVWTTLKAGHLCPCQNCSQWPPGEKTGRGSMPNRPSCPPDDPIGQGAELNWTTNAWSKSDHSFARFAYYQGFCLCNFCLLGSFILILFPYSLFKQKRTWA